MLSNFGSIPITVDKQTGKLIFNKELADKITGGEKKDDVLKTVINNKSEDYYKKKYKLELMRTLNISGMQCWDKCFPYVKKRTIGYYIGEIRDYKLTAEDLECDDEYDSPFAKFYRKIRVNVELINKVVEAIVQLQQEAKGTDISGYTNYMLSLVHQYDLHDSVIPNIKMWMFTELRTLDYTIGYKPKEVSECPFLHTAHLNEYELNKFKNGQF